MKIITRSLTSEVLDQSNYTKYVNPQNFVPKTRTINSKPLSANITLEPADVGALSGNIDQLYYEVTPGLSANSEATLKYSIENYKLILVYGSIYTNSVNTNHRYIQIMGQTIPRILITQLQRSNDTFLLAGSLSGTTRRIYFGFPTNTTIKTGTIDGTSGNMPRLFAVYGIK